MTKGGSGNDNNGKRERHSADNVMPAEAGIHPVQCSGTRGGLDSPIGTPLAPRVLCLRQAGENVTVVYSNNILNYPVLKGPGHCFGLIMHVQLFINIADVRTHRIDADK